MRRLERRSLVRRGDRPCGRHRVEAVVPFARPPHGRPPSAVVVAPLDQLDVISARGYGERGYPHAEWERLRRESPVHFMRPEGYLPFWAVTKHADIVEVSKQPEVFRSAGRFILFPEEIAPGGQSQSQRAVEAFLMKQAAMMR